MKKLIYSSLCWLIIALTGCVSNDVENESEKARKRNLKEIQAAESYCKNKTDFEWQCKGISIKLNNKLLIGKSVGNIKNIINLNKLNNSLSIKVDVIDTNKYSLELIFKPYYAGLGADCNKYICLDSMNDTLFYPNQKQRWRLGFIFNYQEGLFYSNGWYRKVIDTESVRFSTYGTRKIIFRKNPDENITELNVTPYINIRKRFVSKESSYDVPNIMGEGVWFSTIEECEQCV